MQPVPEFRQRRELGAVRILQLEDDEAFAALVRENLSRVRWADVTLERVATLREALASLSQGRFDLVITDLSVPDSRGLDTLDSLASMSDSPIIVLTGEPDESLREQAIERGAYDFLSKDRIDRAELGRLVRLAAIQASTFLSARKSEARLRGMTELLSDWLWEQDEEFRFTQIGTLSRKVTPNLAARALGKRPWELPNLAPLNFTWAEHRACLEARQPFRDLELARELDDGSHDYVSISAVPVFDDGGRFRGYQGLARDITAAVKAERVLRTSEERFRSLTKLSSDWYWEQDEQFRFVQVSGGLTNDPRSSMPDEQIGKARWELTGLDPMGTTWDAHRALIGRHEPYKDLQLRRRLADGSVLYLSVSGEPVFDAAGAFTGYRGTTKDITEHKRGEEALRLAELSYRSIFENSVEGIYRVDASGRVTAANPALARILGYQTFEELQAGIASVAQDVYVDPAARKRYRNMLRAQGVVSGFETQWRRRDGSSIWVSMSGRLVQDPVSGERYHLGIAENISQRKREERLLGLEHSAARSLAEAQSTAGGLEAVLRAICESEGWQCGRYFHVDETAAHIGMLEGWCDGSEGMQRFLDGSRGLALERGAGLVGSVWESAAPVWVPDACADPRIKYKELEQTAGVHGTLVFPAMLQERVIGVLAVSSSEVREPDARLLRAMSLIGTQIAHFLQRKHAERELRESEERFRSLTGLSSDFYWETDKEHRISEASHGPVHRTVLKNMTGEARWNLPSVYPDAAGWASHKAVLDAHQPFRDFEFARLDPGGAECHLSISGEPVLDESGAFRGYRGIGRDITELKKRDEELRRFRLAMDSSADIIVLTDRATMKYVDVNATACRLLGYSREELLQLGPQDVLTLSREDIEKSYEELIANPSLTGGLKSSYRCKDGSLLPFESTRHVLRSGNAWLVAAVSRDIRERQASEKALRASEERFRSLAELSSDFYWESDAEHRVVRTGGSSRNSAVVNPAQLGKARWDMPSASPDAAGWAAHRATMEAHRPFRDFEIARVDENGIERYRSISGEPVFDDSGAFTGYRGVGKDITARKREERLVALEHSAARLLAEAQGEDEAIRSVIRAICESENWACGRYFHLDEAGGSMRFRQAWSRPGASMQAFTAGSVSLAYEPGQGLIGAAWQQGEVVWATDAASDPRVAQRALARQAGLHGAVVFPVSFEGRIFGVLSMSSERVREPDRRLLEAVQIVGTQLGQYLLRKRGEEAIRRQSDALTQSEARFRETFELAAAGIAHVAADGRFLKVNRKLCEILGYSEQELLGLTVKGISHPQDRDVMDGPLDRLRRGEVQSVRREKRYLRRSGEVVWIELTVAVTRNAAGEVQHDISIYEDITERKASEDALRRFRAALDGSADMVFLAGMHNLKLIDFNGTACTYLGYRPEELVGVTPELFLADVTTEQLRAGYASLLAKPGRADSVVRRFRRKDGRSFEAEVLRRVIDSPDGPIIVINARDLTERNLAEERKAIYVRHQEEIARFGAAALDKRERSDLIKEAVHSAIEGLRVEAVAYIERGQDEREIVLKAITGFAGAGDRVSARYEKGHAIELALEQGELSMAEGAGCLLPFEWAERFACAVFVPIQGDEGPQGMLCALSSDPAALGQDEFKFLVTTASVLSAGLRRIDSEGRLAFLAQFDALTGLPNRALLSDRFSQMIVHGRRHATPLGVLFIDLDHFKLVNDTLGHAGGDELLKETARRLQSAVRPGDTVARISGDEFAVILGDLARPDDAALVAQKIIDRLGAPLQIRGQEVFVSASIGIAAFPADGDDAEALLGAADAAMYRAKQSGRNAYQFFTTEINQRTRARAQLGSDLRRALERDEFALVYQPKFDLHTGMPCAAEALLRWQRPGEVMISPAEFIPVLEETGLIVQVGEWVLRRACTDLKGWQAAGIRPLPIAVNLSARQFRQQDLDARIRAIVEAAGVDPELIELEITESQLMHDPDHAIRVVRALNDAGMRIAIDDFGTGYSSLSYLTRFAVSALKIDRSFVADVLSDQADAAIVRTIVDMAHTLGFTVIAEGVETEGQAAFLRGLGCEQAQGFLFARPMPAAQLAALISAAALAPPGKERRGKRWP